jgi:Kef-type K+ transport system membrane component KefB
MSEPDDLVDILVLLAVAVFTVPVFQRLRLGSVLGYLAAGALVCPWGFGFIHRIEEIRYIAEFGVVFLLFIIGMELQPSRRWPYRSRSRRACRLGVRC